MEVYNYIYILYLWFYKLHTSSHYAWQMFVISQLRGKVFVVPIIVKKDHYEIFCLDFSVLKKG